MGEARGKVHPEEIELENAVEIFDVHEVIGLLLDRVKAPRLALHIRRVARAVQDAMQDVIEQEKTILRECRALEDEMGFVQVEDERGNKLDELVFMGDTDEEVAANRKEYVRRRKELYTSPLMVSCVPLSARHIEEAGIELSGREALALGNLLRDDFEEEEDG